MDDGPTVQELLSRRKSAEDALRAARDLLERARDAIERGESSIEEFAASVARQLQPPLRALRLFAHGVRARRGVLPAEAVTSAERIDAEAECLQQEIAALLAEREVMEVVREPEFARRGAAAIADPDYGGNGNAAWKSPRSAPASATAAVVSELVHEINDPLTAVTLSLELLAGELAAVREESRVAADGPQAESIASAHSVLDEWLVKLTQLLDDARGGADHLCKIVGGLKLAVSGNEPTAAHGGLTPGVSEWASATRRRAVDARSDAGAPCAEDERETSRPPRATRVLVVDDDAAIVQVVRTVLHVDHEVVGTTCVREALDRLTAGERYDLILCDVIMPQMTGTELYEQLQRTHPEQARRVVLMTGGARANAERGAASSTPVVLEKPFDVNSLRALVTDRLDS